MTISNDENDASLAVIIIKEYQELVNSGSRLGYTCGRK